METDTTFHPVEVLPLSVAMEQDMNVYVEIASAIMDIGVACGVAILCIGIPAALVYVMFRIQVEYAQQDTVPLPAVQPKNPV